MQELSHWLSSRMRAAQMNVALAKSVRFNLCYWYEKASSRERQTSDGIKIYTFFFLSKKKKKGTVRDESCMSLQRKRNTWVMTRGPRWRNHCVSCLSWCKNTGICQAGSASRGESGAAALWPVAASLKSTKCVTAAWPQLLSGELRQTPF